MRLYGPKRIWVGDPQSVTLSGTLTYDGDGNASWSGTHEATITWPAGPVFSWSDTVEDADAVQIGYFSQTGDGPYPSLTGDEYYLSCDFVDLVQALGDTTSFAAIGSRLALLVRDALYYHSDSAVIGSDAWSWPGGDMYTQVFTDHPGGLVEGDYPVTFAAGASLYGIAADGSAVKAAMVPATGSDVVALNIGTETGWSAGSSPSANGARMAAASALIFVSGPGGFSKSFTFSGVVTWVPVAFIYSGSPLEVSGAGLSMDADDIARLVILTTADTGIQSRVSVDQGGTWDATATGVTGNSPDVRCTSDMGAVAVVERDGTVYCYRSNDMETYQ